MIIHQPEIKQKNDRVICSARLSYKTRPLNKPDSLWFSFPETYAAYISGRTDPFAAGLLQLAMYLHEDMTIEGSLSPQLLNGMYKYQQTMCGWFPKLMQPVNIIAKRLEALPAENAGQNCVTLFSGGVDSSYTLRAHLPDQQPDPVLQVKGALFIHGLDIPLQNRDSYQGSLALFDQHIAPLGVDMIPCATNLRYFTSGLINWGLVFGSAVTSTGLVLDQMIGTLLVSSSSISETIPWGSSPLIDHYLSTESVNVIHDGAAVSRIEKINLISDWEPAQNFLRVCVNEKERSPDHNCSQCEKCLRTMTMLEICGALSKFKTFSGSFGKWSILKWTPHYEHGRFWMPDTVAFVKSRQKNQLIFPLRIADIKGRLRNGFRNLIPRPLFVWLKNKIYPYQKDPFNPEFLKE